MAENHLIGRGASPGLAIGPVTMLTAAVARRTASDDPAQEAEALRAAIEGARAEIAEQIKTIQGEVADILEFQVDMLEDDALAVAAYEVISVGITADRAWRLALDVEIAGYRAAEDEYFLARAADIVDIRIRARWPGEGIVGCSGAHSGAALGNLITSRGLVFRLQPKNESCSIAASRKSIAAGESALVYPAKFNSTDLNSSKAGLESFQARCQPGCR